MLWLPDGEKCLTIRLAVSIEYRRVTDGRTDGQTDGHLATAKSALCIASRGKNQYSLL